MKKKILWIITGIIILVIIGVVLFLILKNKESETESEYTTSDVKVSTQTIQNTLSSSGEITSESEEISLNTYRYFKELLVDTNTIIKKGTKILKYTNGKYYTAPYDLVLTSYLLPESKSKITDQHYLKVQSLKTMIMYLSIDEIEINKIKVGQEVQIVANAYEDKTYTGKITFINQLGSYSSNGSTYTATVEFENDGNLKIGMSATVSVVIEEANDVIAVPIEAIQTKGKTKYVVVVENNTTKEVEVETGISNDAYVEIKSGLDGTETVRMIEKTTSSDNNMFGGMNMPQMNSDTINKMKEFQGETPPTNRGQ